MVFLNIPAINQDYYYRPARESQSYQPRYFDHPGRACRPVYRRRAYYHPQQQSVYCPGFDDEFYGYEARAYPMPRRPTMRPRPNYSHDLLFEGLSSNETYSDEIYGHGNYYDEEDEFDDYDDYERRHQAPAVQIITVERPCRPQPSRNERLARSPVQNCAPRKQVRGAVDELVSALYEAVNAAHAKEHQTRREQEQRRAQQEQEQDPIVQLISALKQAMNPSQQPSARKQSREQPSSKVTVQIFEPKREREQVVPKKEQEPKQRPQQAPRVRIPISNESDRATQPEIKQKPKARCHKDKRPEVRQEMLDPVTQVFCALGKAFENDAGYTPESIQAHPIMSVINAIQQAHLNSQGQSKQSKNEDTEEKSVPQSPAEKKESTEEGKSMIERLSTSSSPMFEAQSEKPNFSKEDVHSDNESVKSGLSLIETLQKRSEAIISENIQENSTPGSDEDSQEQVDEPENGEEPSNDNRDDWEMTEKDLNSENDSK